MRFSILIFLFAAMSVARSADSIPGDKMLAEFFKTQTAILQDNAFKDIHSLEDWTARKPEYRRQLAEMLGIWPSPARTDLKTVITGELSSDEFRVEKIQYQSMPGLYVTANVYVPKNITKPVPAILYLCGHAQVVSNGVSLGNKTGYQHHGAWFARNGYICMVVDTIQLGEISGIHHGTYREKMWWWNSRGYTPAGVEAWNGIRALDYLQSRSDVNPEKIGVTGRSGGGAYTWYITALDDRVKVAAPIAGITDLKNHIIDGCVSGHCDCMFMVNTYRWDYTMLAALAAPRPLLLGNSDKDRIFPLDGVLRTHAKVKAIYDLYGASNQLGLIITDGPHQDTQELQLPVFRWFNRFLKGDSNSIVEKVATNFFTATDLKVFDKLPSDERTSKIHETFVPIATGSIPENKFDWELQRDTWKRFLGEKVFAAWPRPAAGPPLEKITESTANGIHLQEFQFISQQGIELPLFVAKSKGARPSRIVLRVLEQSEWTSLKSDLTGKTSAALTAELAKEPKAILVFVLPRGIGPTEWTSELKEATHIRRRFMLLGTTVDAMRVWDIQSAIHGIASNADFRKLPIELHAAGEMGVNALYASIYAPSVQKIAIAKMPVSHATGPDYLNVLKGLDIPQVVSMAAENSKVKLIGTDPVAWKFPVEVANKLKRNSIEIAP